MDQAHNLVMADISGTKKKRKKKKETAWQHLLKAFLNTVK